MADFEVTTDACVTTLPWDPSADSVQFLNIGDQNQDNHDDIAVLGCDGNYAVYYDLTGAGHYSPVNPERYQDFVKQNHGQSQQSLLSKAVDKWVIDPQNGIGHVVSTFCVMGAVASWQELIDDAYDAIFFDLGGRHFLFTSEHGYYEISDAFYSLVIEQNDLAQLD